MTTAVPRRLCWGHQLCLSISQALQFGRLEPLVTTYHQSQIVAFHLFLSPLSPPLHLNWGSIPQFTLGPSLLPPRRRAIVNKLSSASCQWCSFESVECSPLHQPAPLPFSNNLGFLFGQPHRLGNGDFHIPGSRDTGTQGHRLRNGDFHIPGSRDTAFILCFPPTHTSPIQNMRHRRHGGNTGSCEQSES